MKRLAITIVTIILLSPAALAVRHVVPIAGHLPGALGTTWTTDLMLFNSLPQPASVTLVFRPTNAERVDRIVTLDPGESRLLKDVANPTLYPGENPDSWIGQLEIVTDGGVDVQARIYTDATDQGLGTYGTASPVLDPNAFLQRGIVAGLTQNAQYRTNVAFVNPSAMTITFQLVIHDRDGSAVVQTAVTVGPYQSLQVPFTSLAQLSGDGYSLEWVSPEWEGYVFASVIDNGSGDPAAIPSAGAGIDTLFFPIVGKTLGAHGTDWATSIVLTSDSLVAGSVEMELNDNEAGNMMITLPIDAHGTLIVSDLYEMFGLEGGSGFLTITSTVPVVGHARIFNTVDAMTYGSLVPSQESATVSGFVHIRGVQISDEYRFNVAITNRDFVDAGGFLRVYDNRRDLVHSEPFQVPARTTLQLPLPQTLALSAGEVAIQPNQNRTITAVGSNIDNHTGDTVIIEGRE